MTIEEIRDLLPLIPRAVDLLWRRGSGPLQCDEAGEKLPMPLLDFALPLDDMEAARAFLPVVAHELAMRIDNYVPSV